MATLRKSDSVLTNCFKAVTASVIREFISDRQILKQRIDERRNS